VPSVEQVEELCAIASGYVNFPITPYRKKLFTEVISCINKGNVLDLGCGQAGTYWALGYADRVDSITFVDYHESNIRATNKQLNELSPSVISEQFGDSFGFLQSAGILSPHSNEINVAEAIIEKVVSVDKLDFLDMCFKERFDFILSVEALECVNDYMQLKQVLANCFQALASDGRLLGVAAMYDVFTDRTRELIEVRLEGSLNPDEQILLKAFEESGFTVSFTTTVQTPERFNYSKAVIFDVKRD
jgi:SAM-dependent methyltransferase